MKNGSINDDEEQEKNKTNSLDHAVSSIIC